MTGGVSQLETFDPKPEAISGVRGPFKSIETAVPGLRFGESLPGLARRADQLAVIRSLNHDAAPIHETGQQLLQTGRLSFNGISFPNWSSVVAKRSRPAMESLPVCYFRVPLSILVCRPIADSRPDCWESIGSRLSSRSIPATNLNRFGECTARRGLDGCCCARQMLELGTRCVTVNLFDSLRDQITWDCHGDKNCGPASLFDYQTRLCPEFDQAFSGLLDDLGQRGLLHETLVIASGEFGRTPYVNENMGRDHWPDCWSALVAGGKTAGGKIIGASDASAAAPIERPVAPGELTATLLHWFGVDATAQTIDVDQREIPLVPHLPIHELWGSASLARCRALNNRPTPDHVKSVVTNHYPAARAGAGELGRETSLSLRVNATIASANIASANTSSNVEIPSNT